MQALIIRNQQSVISNKIADVAGMLFARDLLFIVYCLFGAGQQTCKT